MKDPHGHGSVKRKPVLSWDRIAKLAHEKASENSISDPVNVAGPNSSVSVALAAKSLAGGGDKSASIPIHDSMAIAGKSPPAINITLSVPKTNSYESTTPNRNGLSPDRVRPGI